MHPYRPLHVARVQPEPPRASFDLRGLAVVLIVLGALRLMPAVAASERFNTETVMAVLLLAVGVLELATLRRRIRRWRRRRLHRSPHRSR